MDENNTQDKEIEVTELNTGDPDENQEKKTSKEMEEPKFEGDSAE